jgi:hypothetical protein
MTKKFRIWDKELAIYTEHAELRNGILEDILLHPKGGFLLIRDNGLTKVLDEDRFVLEQFTGLLDATGREIYEGDIVEYEPNKPINRIGQIEWSNYYNGWSIRDKECYPVSDFGVYSLASPFLSFNHVRVVGHIHENNT